MAGQIDRSGDDPRSSLSPDDLDRATLWAAPQVARKGGGDWLGLAAGGLVALALGAYTLTSLSQARAAPSEEAVAETAPPLTPLASEDEISDESDYPAPPPPPVFATEGDAALPASAAPVLLQTAEDPAQSRANPMIIDNSLPQRAGAGGAPKGAANADAATANLTSDEQFAFRAGGRDAVARAQRLTDPTYTVAQGTLIPAVLETALNSDLPGYVRAIVSRDVRGFDGRRVMIPRGSRLIGQYRNGVQTGQSRAFVIWTRLIRPDGVSVELGSPAADELGQSGLSGQVDRHYAQRYGPAALLSVLSGIASSIGGGSSSTVVVGSTASGAAGQALQTDGQIPPTIRLRQGAPIQVFAARDLNFSAG